MDTVIHSPFLQALGYAIINSLWQFALLWLLYFSINTVFKLSSHQKYVTGLVLELTGFTWFAGTLLFYYKQCLLVAQQALINQPDYLQTFTVNAVTSTKQSFFLFAFHVEQFFPYLSIAYLALLLVLSIRWMYAYRYTQQVRMKGLLEIDLNWNQFVQKLSSQLGIKRSVTIFLSELVQTPLTVGFLKPLILIPVATVNYLNQQQMEAVILHELAHIKRFDYLFNLLLALIEACLFFNPFMQLINHQVKKERENCCDDWVLQYNYSAASYARALLQIASHQTFAPKLALSATDNKRLLITRIKRIIEKNERTFFNYKYQLLALVSMTIFLSLLSFLSPGKKVLKSSTLAAQPAKIESMAGKISNPLFNPVFFLANIFNSNGQNEKLNELKVEKNKKEAKVASLSFEKNSLKALEENAPNNVIDKAFANALTFETSLKNPDTHFNTIMEMNGKDRERQYLLTEENPKENEIAANNFKRDQSVFLEQKNTLMEKVKDQLQNALSQIKLSKRQIELNKLQNIVRIGIRKIQKEKRANLLPDINDYKVNELELLEKRIELTIDSLSQNEFFTKSPGINVNYNIQLPPVLYTTPPQEVHSFSYEYPTKPRIRIIRSPVSTNSRVVNRKENIVVFNGDEEEIEPAELPAPPSPAPPALKTRTVYIIKI